MMSILRITLLVVAQAIFAVVAVNAAPLPSDAKHLGVASCAGSTCHGAVKPIGKYEIRQDEYFIWQRKDAHAQAHKLLLEGRSDRISRNLGWGKAAEADGCLVCHTDHIAPSAQGEKWLMSDGVGCEACHGGSENWIGSHVDGYDSREAAIKDGLYPTWDDAARAEMCLSCHQGDAKRPMTHAIMAAGHPPLLFELDTFGTLAPYHHDVDPDYVERKGEQDAARSWAVGQAMAADMLLGNLAQGRHKNGLMPELAFFDCDACHHSMEAQRWHAGRTGNTPPGTVPLLDASMVMTGAWLSAVDPALASRWRQRWKALYASGIGGESALQQQAKKLQGLLRESVLLRAKSTRLDDAQLKRVLSSVIAAASGAHAGDFQFAQQTAMASLVLGSAIGQRRGQALLPSEQKAIDDLYAAVQDRDRFSASVYRKALNRVKSALRV